MEPHQFHSQIQQRTFCISALDQLITLYLSDPLHFPYREDDFISSVVHGFLAQIENCSHPDPDYSDQLNTALKALQEALKRCQAVSIQLLDQYRLPIEVRNVNSYRAVSLASLLDVVSLVIPAFSINTLTYQGMPSEDLLVGFYPMINDLLSLLISVIADHERGHQVTIAVQTETDAAVLRITNRYQSMLMTDWQYIEGLLEIGGRDEILRELGGSIEPLTWDEGYGEGVILRLPWAKAL